MTDRTAQVKCHSKGGSQERSARTESKNKIARKGQPVQRQPVQDMFDREPGHENQYRTARIKQSGQDNQNRTVGQDRTGQDRTA